MAAAIPGARFATVDGEDSMAWLGDGDGVIGEIEEFLTGSRTPAPCNELRAIVFTDIVGSTEPAARLHHKQWQQLLSEQYELVRREIALYGGWAAKAIGELLICQGSARVGRAVLASCDAFDNFPPGLSGKMLVLTGKPPSAGFGAFMQQLCLRAVRRLPIAFGWLTRRGDAVTRRWLEPILTQPEIRRDAVRALRAVAAEPKLMVKAAECLPKFERPALVVWAAQDRIMPPEHGRRLAELLPNGRLVEIDEAATRRRAASAPPRATGASSATGSRSGGSARGSR